MKPDKPPRLKPLSFYGQDPVEVIRRFLRVNPEKVKLEMMKQKGSKKPKKTR